MTETQPREQLHALFKTGAKPSEEDFQTLIDSVINITDDAIGKPAGEGFPVTIGAQGKGQNLLDFYAHDTHLWRVNQTAGHKPGLNVSTGGEKGSSRLFIESSSGKVGLGTAQPMAQLHVQQLANQPALRLEAVNKTPLLAVDASGKLGLGIAQPKSKLHIHRGELQITASHSAVMPNIATFHAQDHKQGIGIGYNQLAAVGSNQNQDLRLVPKGTGKVVVASGGLSTAGTAPSSFGGHVGIGAKSPKIHLALGADDTGLKYESDGRLAIFTNKAERLSLTTAGNLGIGTSSPKIHLAIGDNDTGLKQQGDGKLAIFTNNTERVRIDKTGHVGIGIVAPTKRLHVENGELRVRASHNNASADIGTFFAQNQTQGVGIGYNRIAAIGSNKNVNLNLIAKGTGSIIANSPLSITGNATIGGTLSVDGNASVKGNFSVGNNKSVSLPGHIYLSRYPNQSVAYLQAREDKANVNISLQFRTQAKGKSSRSIVEAMRLTHEGKLGIGTTAPSDKLNVHHGDIRINGGYHRRLKIVSDEHWTGIELVCREQNGKKGNPYIDFTHGELDQKDANVRLYSPDNNNLRIAGGTLGFDSDGDKPFIFKKYTHAGDNPRVNTGFASATWVIAIVGFKVNSSDKAKGQYVYPYVNSGKWWIAGDIMGPKDKDWEFTVLAIRRTWAKVDGRW